VPRQAKPIGLLQPVRALLFLAAFLLADPAAADSLQITAAPTHVCFCLLSPDAFQKRYVAPTLITSTSDLPTSLPPIF
jgi:hypothetical protein